MAPKPPIERAFDAHHKATWRSHVSYTGKGLRNARDAGRQACYTWESKHLRPGAAKLERQAAKGLARLAAKKAIKLMQERGTIRTEADAQTVRNSFKACFANEYAAHCWGSSAGVYFANWGWTVPVILHEVAHWADQWAQMLDARNAGTYGHPEFWGHGPKWRGWFLWLLTEVEWAGHKYDLATLKSTFPGAIRLPNSLH